jgi:hypothetical protein
MAADFTKTDDSTGQFFVNLIKLPNLKYFNLIVLKFLEVELLKKILDL